MSAHSRLPLQHPILFVSIVAFAGFLLAGCAESARSRTAPPVVLAGPTMGTQYQIRLGEMPTALSREDLQAEIDRRLELVNDQMSTYRPDSELSRFNSHQGTDWFDVSPATARVVARALEISRLSDGAFDATVGPLINLWSFGHQTPAYEVPSDDALAEAQARIGYERIEARDDPPALRKSRGDVDVNLSGIAKGYGVDVIAEYLDEQGISSYMVEIGGEIRTRGVKADGSPWKIGIETPTADRRDLYKALPLGDRALATSGDYRNFFEQDGRCYSHTIDPRTGRPVDHTLASVSVIAENCMDADALATALMVLGPDAGYNWAVEHDFAVLMIARDGKGFVEKTTPKFDEWFGEGE
jgi:FAD:protein FMN transferase